MIKVAYAADLFRRPMLAASMFRDRAAQFHERLGWASVTLDDQGLEFDQYDDLNPLYVIMEGEDGTHLGSGRLMPTTERCMINEHFTELTDGVPIRSPIIWETTRFCVSPRIKDRRLALRVPSALLWAGCELAARSGVEFYAGVFAAPMLRVYKAAGWSPEVLGRRWTPEGEICAGLWEVTPEARERLAQKAAAGGDEPTLKFIPNDEKFELAAPRAAISDFAVCSELAALL